MDKDRLQAFFGLKFKILEKEFCLQKSLAIEKGLKKFCSKQLICNPTTLFLLSWFHPHLLFLSIIFLIVNLDVPALSFPFLNSPPGMFDFEISCSSGLICLGVLLSSCLEWRLPAQGIPFQLSVWEELSHIMWKFQEYTHHSCIKSSCCF